MYKEGSILDLDTRKFEGWLQNKNNIKDKVVPIKIIILDIETGLKKTFQYFKWEDDEGAFTINSKAKQKILYRVDGDGDTAVLLFKLVYN